MQNLPENRRHGRKKTLLVLTVATLDFAVVSRRVRTDWLVPDTQLGGSLFKQCWQIALAVRKTVGKLEPVVRLDTFHLYASAGVPRPQLPQEVCRGIGGLLRVGSEEAQASKLVNGGVLRIVEAPDPRCIYGAQPFRPPAHAPPDGSSAHKALVCTSFLAFRQGTSPFCA